MKKHLILPIIAASLVLSSCGDKDADVAKQETANQEAAVAQKTGSHQAVKAALKSQVNSVTADLMLKVPSYLDLTPAEYNMPDSLEGRDMVQVTVKWPIAAKDDLYSLDSVLHELESKPTVISKQFSKGDQVDYVESIYVLAADGGGGYISQTSRFTKQGFEWPKMDIKSNLGKVTLVKGSDEHMAAVKEATTIKQAADEKVRIAKAEAEAKKIAQAKQDHDELVSKYENTLQNGFVFSGVLPRNTNDNRAVPVKVYVLDSTEKAGRSYFNLRIVYKGKKNYKAKLSGWLQGTDHLTLKNVEPSIDTWNSEAPRYLDDLNVSYELQLSDHNEKVELVIVSSDKKKYGVYELLKD